MEAPEFWDNQEKAQETISALKPIKLALKPFDELEGHVADLEALLELADEEGGEEVLPDAEALLGKLSSSVAKTEFQAMMGQETDPCGAFVGIHAGAGGTEACDWAGMLYRMYTRWAENHGHEIEVVDLGEGDSAGIRTVTFVVRGDYAYGHLRCEAGVHRLVRISPFDSNARRHTSFAAVEVTPELDDDIEVDLKESDVEMETFMSGGPGGQHQNKTASGVRLRHLPSGVVVECRNERSQHKNRKTAMKMLKSRLYRIEQEKREAEMAKLYDEKGQISFGSQIRSYVLHPYQLVKDLRTEVETGNTGAVLDGEIDQFIESYLRSQIGK
ncbi:Peptide chain release factor RF2 [Planctomycetes bacterium Pan216]|uniref:Peptide chain release factor 2 n=2 Tax=Kolteria novifilia TaxID=2527975 RepID=A0A518B0U1_9BACT|nr:Peptide chain release factor RF2 [Planctomycetes bacterium Pan216]